jgi:hypothetical protein
MSSSHAPAARVPDRDTRARRAIRLAWISLCLLPISFGGAMVAGDWLLAVQGYQSGAEDVTTTAATNALGYRRLSTLKRPFPMATVTGACWLRRFGTSAAGATPANELAIGLLISLGALRHRR